MSQLARGEGYTTQWIVVCNPQILNEKGANRQMNSENDGLSNLRKLSYFQGNCSSLLD